MADRIKFMIPGKPAYLTMVRLAIGSIADMSGFDIEEIEDMFFIGRKTVQRDISEIRDFLHDLQVGEPVQSEIVYDRNLKKYKLTEMDNLFRVFDKINQIDESDPIE